VPLYVMLPLDTVTILNTLNHVKARRGAAQTRGHERRFVAAQKATCTFCFQGCPPFVAPRRAPGPTLRAPLTRAVPRPARSPSTQALNAGMRALRSVGVDGVSVDIWWGVVEAAAPRAYDWSAYRALVRMVAAAGLKLQVVLSFHSCGRNVGDSVSVSLPPWVLEVADANPDVLFADRGGARSDEYLSFGVDELPLFAGRTPLEMYRDFMDAFRDEFAPYLGSVIPVVAVSLGPAGELRYPAYPEGRWRFPGVGEFQCYDKYMLANLRACAAAAGSPQWGNGGPHDAGVYASRPETTGFFADDGGSWATPYGEFFLSWYAGTLAAHGERVLGAAAAAFGGSGARVMGKLPGVHWWFNTRAHAAEATAGLYNPLGRNGYAPLVAAFARHDALLDFTCAEMRDGELRSADAACGPEALLGQVRATAAAMGVTVAAENALPRFDATAHEQIVRNAYHNGAALPPLASFTYLRMSERLFAPTNWHAFVAFVRRMAFSGSHGMDADDVAPTASDDAAPPLTVAAAVGAASEPFEALLARAVSARRAAGVAA
jgi:beta-amylase